jgi:hypothetical protein
VYPSNQTHKLAQLQSDLEKQTKTAHDTHSPFHPQESPEKLWKFENARHEEEKERIFQAKDKTSEIRPETYLLLE